MEKLKARWLEMDLYRRILLAVMAAEIVGFLIASVIMVNRPGLEYRDALLYPRTEGETQIYEGTVDGEPARFAVSPEGEVSYQWGEFSYGPWQISRDPTAVPDGFRGKTGLESRLIPAVQFLTSDIGVSSAKVIALLEGGKTPIHIGSCVAVDHRCWAKVEDFDKSLDQLFAQFQDSVGKLQKLLNVYLDYPVNAMTRVCKKLNLPKKAALEAIHQFEVTYGGGPATAHDVFLAMQEIPFFLSCDHAPESKLLAVAESLARALTFRWEDYDLAKGVEY